MTPVETGGRFPNRFGRADSEPATQVDDVTDLVERGGEATAETSVSSDACTDADALPASESVAEAVRDRAERVRRRELDTALQRLEARGEITPEQRRVVADLSARVTAAFVERWTAALADDAVDADAALDLFTE